MTLGRPKSFKPEYVDLMIEYFSKPLFEEVVEEVASAGRVIKIKKQRPSNMPTFDEFAWELGHDVATLRRWAKDESLPDFCAAYALCKQKQKVFLNYHGLTGGYNPGFAKFVAINCTDQKDRVVHEVGEINLEFES